MHPQIQFDYVSLRRPSAPSLVIRFIDVRHSPLTQGDRCFAAARPHVWNSLPADL